MVTANLYIDHLAPTSPLSSDAVLRDTQRNPAVYGEAARQIGLTPSEYREFQNDLLAGKAMYVRLPSRLDAMAGAHGSRVYALHNVRLDSTTYKGWEIALSNGTKVFVPQICGNLSLLRAPAHIAAGRPARVAVRKPVKHQKPLTAAYHAAPVSPAAPVAVSLATPQPAAPAEAPQQAPAAVAMAPVVAPVVAATTHHVAAGWILPFFGLLGGGGTSVTTPQAPPCNQGSNALGVCSH